MHFYYDKILNPEEICNLKSEQTAILNAIQKKKNLVIYGRRNIGKTSVLKQLILPAFIKKNPGAFVMFADLLGVKNLNQLEIRLDAAFRHGFSKSKPKAELIKKILAALTHLRPVMTIDPVTGPSFTIGVSQERKHQCLSNLFEAVSLLSQTVPVLIILDEFQDIQFVDEAAGILRNCFQSLGHNCSVIVSGSKKHILAAMFGKSRAPFSGFGEDLEFSEIPYDEYTQYMNERFRQFKKTIDTQASNYLQDLVYRVPEAINIVCDELTEDESLTNIHPQHIIKALASTIDKRQGRFEETLSQLTPSEEKVLTVIAKMDGVEKPSGKEFIAKCGLSQHGVSKIMKKLLDHAEIYLWHSRYILAEPLLHHYLRNYR